MPHRTRNNRFDRRRKLNLALGVLGVAVFVSVALALSLIFLGGSRLGL